LKPLISVIICCHNVAEYLPDCVQSLAGQSIRIEHLQLIFVDDASTDDGKTWNCILEFEKQYPTQVVALHLAENLRQGGARNAGLEYATADYIGYVDGDDWIEPTMYEHLYQRMKEYDCDIVDGRVMLEYPSGYVYVHHAVEDRFDQVEKSIIEGGEHWTDLFSGAGYGGGIVTGLYRKALLLESGVRFPEKILYEDNYWAEVITLFVKRYFHLAEDLYHYRQREDSTVHKKNAGHHLDCLKIEEMKLVTYKELHVYERFTDQIEGEFLKNYYCQTLLKILSKYDDPPYDVFCQMNRRVRELFPDYKNHELARTEGMYQVLLGLIERDLDEEQFREIGKIILSYYGR
jgi:glycosyltransferase involved in cell wall biosynthesis